MKLKIGAKVNLIMVVSLLIMGGVALFFFVSALNKEGDIATEDYRTSVMEEKKNYIKDIVGSAYTIADGYFQDISDKEILRKNSGEQIKAAINQAVSIFEASLDNENMGSMEHRKACVMNVIEKMRWGVDQKGYFWIQDTNGNMVMHPMKPSLNGKALFGIKDPDGKRLFKDFDDIAKAKGAGFVDYKWPKPGFYKPVDKISYVKLFKPWGWIIGGGMYLESSEALLKEQALKSIGSIRFGENNSGYFGILHITTKVLYTLLEKTTLNREWPQKV